MELKKNFLYKIYLIDWIINERYVVQIYNNTVGHYRETMSQTNKVVIININVYQTIGHLKIYLTVRQINKNMICQNIQYPFEN